MIQCALAVDKLRTTVRAVSENNGPTRGHRCIDRDVLERETAPRWQLEAGRARQRTLNDNMSGHSARLRPASAPVRRRARAIHRPLLLLRGLRRPEAAPAADTVTQRANANADASSARRGGRVRRVGAGSRITLEAAGREVAASEVTARRDAISNRRGLSVRGNW